MLKPASRLVPEHIEIIGSYTQNYGGGPGAPIIKFLEFFSKEFGGGRKLGQDFFSALEALEFAKGQGSRPLARSACIATNMTGPKVQDGFYRFLSPTQVEKMNSKALVENVDKVESALQLSWTTMQTCISQGTDEYEAYKHFGRLSCRSIMWLFKNGKTGFEGKDYDDLQSLVDKFDSGLYVAPSPTKEEKRQGKNHKDTMQLHLL